MIVLDTHAWIWYVTDSLKLPSAARQAIDQAEQLGVHIISCWEVAMLVEKRRIGFNCKTEDWITMALNSPKIKLLPFDPSVAILAAQLNNFHGDPADRFIAATCLYYQIPLISKDRLIKHWQQISVIW